MQLILDADEIDIKGNMSTIEHESLSEKFHTNKIVEHLADDISNGNKENIQKQDNIISEQAVAEDNNDTEKDVESNKDVETDKGITTNKELVNNLNGESSKEDNNAEDEIEKNLEEDEISKSEVEQNPKCNNDTIENVENKNCQAETTEMNLEEEKEEEKEDLEELEGEYVLMPENNTASDECVLVEDSSKSEVPTNSNNDTEIQEIKSDTIKDVDLEKQSKEKEEEPSSKSQIDDDDNKLTESSLDKSTEIVINSNSSQNTTSINVPDKDIQTSKSVSSEKVEIEVGDQIVDEKVISGGSEKTTSVDVTDAEVKTTNSSSNESNSSIEIVDEDLKANSECSEKDTSVETVNENTPSNKEEDISNITNENNSNSCKEVAEVSEKMEVNDDSNAAIAPASPQSNVVTEKAKDDVLEPKRFCRLSNNLEIFSDEEDDSSKTVPKEPVKDSTEPPAEKQCISLDDDDDIMLIDEDTSTKDTKTLTNNEVNTDQVEPNNIEPQTEDQSTNIEELIETPELKESVKDTTSVQKEDQDNLEPSNETPEKPNIEPESIVDKVEETQPQSKKKPLLPKNFIKSYKKNLADMTRDELEEFCILKIVESIVDRSNLGEIKSQLKNLTQTMEECKKKCLMLSKQNKDLQVVLKSVQEDQKSGLDNHITPLKITRSVGMQVVMVADKGMRKRQLNGVASPAPAGNNTANNKAVKSPITNNSNNSNTKTQKERNSNNQQIPVPRLVPAVPASKANQISAASNSPKKVSNIASPNGIRVVPAPPPAKAAEKRPRAQSQSITVDLTDDEPPAKVQTVQRTNLNQTSRVAGNQQQTNIIAAQRYGTNINSPRQVYIPISGTQAQNVRPGQSIMLRAVSGLPPRQRFPAAKVPQAAASMRLTKLPPSRHPAPLPEVAKQYQPASWKTLPPAPDLKLSKVENGIVISWKIDNYQEDNHEQIASYQLYAYQETQSPPSTALWKKIGDVKALPLPMACTLTQFMAGYKYYFAVRAVDVRSRFGPFSLPGSILLLNKL